MAMMYKIVAQALEKAGLSDCYHPQDYLNFYCLGKREASSSTISHQRNRQTENRALVCYSFILDTIRLLFLFKSGTLNIF
jgi:phospholipase D1/2